MLTQKDLEREVREISNFLGVLHYGKTSIVMSTTKDVVISFTTMLLAKNRLVDLGFVISEFNENNSAKQWLEENNILYFCISFDAA